MVQLRRGADPLQTFAFLSVFGIVIVWASYFWEKSTGMTFVVGRDLRRYGDVSTAAHLAGTLHTAQFMTFLCGAYLFFWFVVFRQSE